MDDRSSTSTRTARAPSAFGETLRRLRLAAGLTQEALAERASMSARAISDLERGINRAPQPTTLRLLADALALSPADRARLDAEARPPVATPSASPIPNNLPAPVTPMIGRDTDLAAARAILFEDGARLLTVTGPGGVGKTRFALDLATSLRGHFPDGVWFVPLATIREPDFLLTAIAQALRLTETDEQAPLDRLVRYLRDKRLLLVLDNFEHLITEAFIVANLLAAAPGLTILVASRLTLHLRGEFELPLAPLVTPSPDAATDPILLAQIPAVALFCQRARAARHGFALTQENAATISAICARLEGLPLAIEIAAARLKYLTPTALLTRLEHRLSELTDGPRDLPTRQRTMRAAVAGSYDMLGPSAQRLLRRLAAFVDGCTEDAAQAVSGGDTGDIAHMLSALVDHSLVQSTPQAGSAERYLMLETIREYGAEQLAAHGESEDAQRRHCAYYAAFVETAAPALRGPEQFPWLARVDIELGNLRAALQHTIATNNVVPGLRFATGLSQYFFIRGYLREGRDWLDRTLAIAKEDTDQSLVAARTRAQIAAGGLAIMQGDYAAATALLEPALDHARQAAWMIETADGLARLGEIAIRRGDFTRAQTLLEESLTIQRALGSPWDIADSLRWLGTAAMRHGDYDRGEALFAECLERYREAGDPLRIAIALAHLGIVAESRGDYPRATTLYEEALAIRQHAGRSVGLAILKLNIGRVAQKRGLFAEATALLEEGLTSCAEIGNRPSMADALNQLGIVARRQGMFAQALERYEEALAIRHEMGDKPGIASLFNNMGNIRYDQGDLAGAQDAYAENLARCRDLGDRPGIATALHNLGYVAARRGDYPAAAVLHAQSLTLRREIGDTLRIGESLEGLSGALRAQGDLAGAATTLGEAITLFRVLDARVQIAGCLEEFGFMAWAEGQPERAARYFGAASALRDAAAAPPAPIERAAQEATISALRSALGEAAFAGAWDEGRVEPLAVDTRDSREPGANDHDLAAITQPI